MARAYEINSDERFSRSLEYIKHKITKKDIVCDINTRGNRTVLSIQGNPNQFCIQLVDALADIIITDCKSHYINDHIRLPIIDPVTRNAFTCALLAFDHDTDKIIAKTIIRLSPKFYLDSLYDFMLDVLKSRWDEVCLLANENTHYLACPNTFNELLQFLISNIDCEMDEAMFMHIRENALREDVKKLFCSCVKVN